MRSSLPGFCPPLLRFVLGAVLWLGVAATGVAEMPGASADERWGQIKEIQLALSTDAPKGVNEVEHFAPVKARLHREAEAFASDFPADSRRWEAKLLSVKTTDFPMPAKERQTIFDRNEAIVASIGDAADAPPEIKQNAVRTILFQHLDHLDLVGSPKDAAALEARLLAYVRDYPDDPKAASMQVRRADLLARSDPSKVRPLLEELARNANPKVAAAAQGRLTQQGLTTVPLDWKFIALDGREVDFSQFRGRVILIDYWASWCPDCLRALPQVLAAFNKYHDKGFEVVGVSLDSDREALESFLKKRVMPWPEYFDGKGWQSEIVTKYGVGGIPEMWLVGKDGRVAAAGVQADELETKVAKLLGD